MMESLLISHTSVNKNKEFMYYGYPQSTNVFVRIVV